MHVPRDLDGWTLEALQALADAGANEDRSFDFKRGADLRNPQAAPMISKAVSAFANSDGGFLVFGVEQPQNDAKWIINPIEPSTEVAQWFHHKVKVEPLPRYEAPRAIPVDDKACYVVHIPASPYGPHASVANQGLVFYHRTHAGCEPMSYDMIRERILGVESRQNAIKLLLRELDDCFRHAAAFAAKKPIDAELDPIGFDLSIVREKIAQLHAPLAHDYDALEKLVRAVRLMRRMNARLSLAAMQMGSLGLEVRRSWWPKIQADAHEAKQAINAARLGVGRVFNVPIGDWN